MRHNALLLCWTSFAVCWTAWILPAQAQTAASGTLAAASQPIDSATWDAQVQPFKPLTFDPEVRTLGAFTRIANTPLRPDRGDGPFPAVVLTPSCGGTGAPGYRERVKELLAAGYLVLGPESYEPRGQKNCRSGVVRGALVMRDTLEALAHLHTLAQVDRTRIYQVGQSMGFFVAAMAASPSVRAHFRSPHRFRASVGWYGSCGFQLAPGSPAAQYVRADIDHPLLLLMAGGDRETPLQPHCFPLLDELKAQGKPVEWHLYDSSITHAWDVNPGYTFTNAFGETIVNRYSAEATADATRRTLEFLARN